MFRTVIARSEAENEARERERGGRREAEGARLRELRLLLVRCLPPRPATASLLPALCWDRSEESGRSKSRE